MLNNPIIKRLAGRWKTILFLVLLVLAVLFAARSIWERAGRRAFVEKLRIGYEKDVVLLPVYANLPDANLFQALILKGIQPHEWDTAGLIRRVLLAAAPAREDLANITGTNWANIVAYDEWQEVCLGAEAWRKAILLQLKHPDRSPDACANRLQSWPPALLRLNRARIYSNEFLDTVVRALQRDAAQVRRHLGVGALFTAPVLSAMPSAWKGPADIAKFQAACALYNAAACLNGLKGTEAWRKAAEEGILKFLEKHQAPDGTIDGNMQATVETIASVMPPLAIAHRAGLPVPPPELSGQLQHLLEFLVYALDMQGCVPFVAPTSDDANQREWLFWGSRIFERPDFAFVAYGGFDMLEASPPPQTSKAFPDLGLYVMRNNWEIRRLIRRKPLLDSEPRLTAGAKQFAYMSNTLHFDARLGRFQIFAFGRPQIAVNLPVRDLRPVWQETDELTICQCRDGQRQLTIIQLNRMNAWVLRIQDMKPEEEVRIQPISTQLKRAPDGAGIVSYSERQPYRMYEEPTHLLLKRYGSVCARTDGAIRETEAGGFGVKANPETRCLTMVFLAANGTGYQGPARTGVPSEETAAARQVTFTEKGCVFDDDLWRSPLAPRIASETGKKVLLEMSADGTIRIASGVPEGAK